MKKRDICENVYLGQTIYDKYERQKLHFIYIT